MLPKGSKYLHRRMEGFLKKGITIVIWGFGLWVLRHEQILYLYVATAHNQEGCDLALFAEVLNPM